MEKKSGRSKFTRLFLYILLALVVFLGGLWYTFPYDHLARFAEKKLAERGMEVEITGVTPVTPLTYSIEKVLIKQAQGSEVNLDLGKIEINLPFSRLISFNPSAIVNLKLLGADTNLTMDLPKPAIIDIDIKGLKFEEIATLFEVKLPNMKGVMDGTAKVRWPITSAKDFTGTINMKVSGLSMGNGDFMGFFLPEINVGGGDIIAESEDGKLRISRCSITGGELDVSLDGTLGLAQNIKRSTIDASITIKPAKSAMEKLGLVFGIISQAQKSDGSYGFKLNGTVGAPNIMLK